jgi:pentatricopeptide repeat protein
MLLCVCDCSRAEKWDAAARVLDEMRASGLGPTLVTYNTRMAQCQRSGHYSDALVLLEEMHVAGVQPDAVTYTSLLWTVGQAPAHTHPRPGPRQWEVRLLCNCNKTYIASMSRQMRSDHTKQDVCLKTQRTCCRLCDL